MIQRDYLIIGGGVTGASVCQAIREHDKKGSVTLIGNELQVPYDRSILATKVIQAKKVDPDGFAFLPEKWYADHKIELRLGTIVTHFNIERRLAVLMTGQTIEFKKACLATGSRPRKPKIAGINLGNIFQLRTMRDALAIREMLEVENKIMLLGGGIVAAEIAGALVGRGCEVSWMCRDKMLWMNRVEHGVSEWLTEKFRDAGIKMLMQESVNGFEGKTILRNIQTKSGQRIPAKVAILALGTDLNLGMIQNTPLASPNGTPVGAHMETDEKGIYAAGDIALYPDSVMGGVRRSPYPGNGIEMGALAGANMTGKKRQKIEMVPHFSGEFLGMRFDFLGDFSLPPGRFERDGDLEKEKFVDYYYQGDRLSGVFLVNAKLADVEKAKEEFLHSTKSR